MIQKTPRLVKRELLEKLDTVERIIAQRFLASGHWIIEEENNK